MNRSESNEIEPVEDRATPRCYGCFRPREFCFCAAIPRIANQTDVLILQHTRERQHPFNTARIIDRALGRSQLLIGHPSELAAATLPFAENAGLLFPSDSALPLSEVPVCERPSQLVIIDGTWHHAKTMVRDIASLRPLPRYRLSPKVPGNYRIRREPTPFALSTLEATVAALQLLEPGTVGFTQLMEAFTKMVDDQLAHPNCREAWRSKRVRNRTSRKVPAALARNVGNKLGNIVVAYGEAAPDRSGERNRAKRPLLWVARRLHTQEQFACAVRADDELSDSMLSHLRLPREFFATAVASTEFRNRWAAFFRSTDTLVVFHSGALSMLNSCDALHKPSIILKSICGNLNLRYPSLDQLYVDHGACVGTRGLPGRAGRRLAGVIGLVLHLSGLASN